MLSGERPVAGIIVGPRHRKDTGEIDGLAASIRDVGLLHPVVVHPDGRLIAGERRLLAARLLGWTDIPASVVDIDSVARAAARTASERRRAGAGASTSAREGFIPTPCNGKVPSLTLQAGRVSATLRPSKLTIGAALTRPPQIRVF